MKQLIQPTSGGPIRIVEVPRPTIGPTEVLVQTRFSVISPGTEGAVTKLAQATMLGKARARPDLVKQVLAKAKREGIASAARAVRARLNEDIPLGYSASGIAIEVGEAVAGIRPGMSVATGGAGWANHAEFQAVPGLLCVPAESVDTADASFATIGAIALHGFRLAEVGPGSFVVVIGLGLVGQLAVRLARAAGCNVAGIDIDPFAVERARAAGAWAEIDAGEDTLRSITEWTRHRGADAVLVAAATSSSDPMRRAAELCRDRASVVVIGDVGLELERARFYEKELTVRFARSYGPGRYERSYEEWGVDYPPEIERWTEGRNMEAVLDLIAAGRLEVRDLVTHRFAIDDALEAYELIHTKKEPFLAIQLSYGTSESPETEIVVGTPKATSGPRIGAIGAGAFTQQTLLPAFRHAGLDRFTAVASSRGLSARRVAENFGFEKITSGADAVISDPDIDLVVIATPHASHAELTARALAAGKHVFCEKPLALTDTELEQVIEALSHSQSILFVGFNRRWSAPVQTVADHFRGTTTPLTITYRVNAAALPPDHWYHDRREGGRLLGEVCHFIDTCSALVGERAATVSAVGSGGTERLLAEHLAVTLTYPNGSVAAITYEGDGSDATEKERIEIIGGGRSATIVDFREVALDGKTTKLPHQDKGHEAEIMAFRAALASGSNEHVHDFIGTTRTTLEAAASLLRD